MDNELIIAYPFDNFTPPEPNDGISKLTITDIPEDDDMTLIIKLLTNDNRKYKSFLDRIKYKDFLTGLKILNLSNNNLVEIDQSLFTKKLKNLEELNLSNNKGLEFISPFSNLTGLKILNLSNCGIEEIIMKDFNGLGNLVELNLSNNNIEKLEENVFENLYSINKIYLNNNELTTISYNHFNKLPHLEELNLLNNKFKEGLIFEIELFNVKDDNVLIEKKFLVEEDDDYDEATDDVAKEDRCFWSIGPYDIKSTDFLKKPNNFLFQLPGNSENYECASLTDMKKTAVLRNRHYNGYYECSNQIMNKVFETGQTPLYFGPGDYNENVEYVQFGTASKYYVEKPDWLWNGPVPEPRKFKLVQVGTKQKYFVSKSVIEEGNVVSDTHCDLGDNGFIYRLENIKPKSRSRSGGGKKPKKTFKKPKNIHKGKKKTKKNICRRRK